MKDGCEEIPDADERLAGLAKVLADTGGKLKSGTFKLNIPPERKEGCLDGRPSFTATAPGAEEAASSSFAIITPFAAEACAFVDHIYGLFRPFLDECIEQDFFERITQAAVEYSCYVDPDDATAVNLMKVIQAEAESIAADMRSGQFPYASKRR